MESEIEPDHLVLDLWGNLVYAVPRKRGRPPFEWTQENSHKVSMLLALGWSNMRIAAAVVDPRTGKKISEPTLKRYFRAELAARDHARDRMVARRFERVWQAAEAGNIGAERLLGQMLERNDLMGGHRRKEDAKAKREAPLGKKESALAAAKAPSADPDWGDDLSFGGETIN